jgi:hypothetical protein
VRESGVDQGNEGSEVDGYFAVEALEVDSVWLGEVVGRLGACVEEDAVDCWTGLESAKMC